MFLGRKRELAFLEKLYNTNELRCVCLTGAAGIGKTALLQEFAKRKRKAYFCVRACTANANKAAFCAELAAQGIVDAHSCADWQGALLAVLKKAQGEKMLLLLDDADELEAAFSEFLPQLLAILREQKDKLRLLIVFSGSDVALTAKALNKAGIASEHITLQPLTYEESLNCFIAFNDDEKVFLYGVTGGKPAYLHYLDDKLSFKENLYRLFYAPDALLLHEGERLLANAFRQPHIYHAVLCSVACGAVHMKDIAEAVGMPVNKTSKYVQVLLAQGFLQRLVPVDELQQNKQHKNTYYVLTDTVLVFWYQFVYPYLRSITMGLGKFLLRTKILPALEKYGRQIFLRICYQHCFVLQERNNFKFTFDRLGFTWKKGACTIDNMLLVAYNKTQVCFMQCLWTKSKVDVQVVKELQREYVAPDGKGSYYIIFSRKGFTDRLLGQEARTKGIRLISLLYLK